ncbi:hypothetical protein FOE78_06395 [Microlunatus elymi]|uniref:Uncharacterized protein n=1 Tax=Microlunatus elymi TaxID=2596828 RepID=A0A516PWN0_9ACTN|nr:hypothetical protein [Microlunatus elymi]QDP95586.1 hypothetical protein FOE78_06395 [Microlunatus elymi]
MTTQELPAVPAANRSTRTRMLIGAGTALKLGFFFALGATLFSLLLTVVAAIIALIFGLSLSSDLRHVFNF